jgi:hypothetical protein
LPIGWIWTKSHTLNRMYAFPLVKLKEDIILLNLTPSGSHLLTDLLWPEGDPNCYPSHIPHFEQQNPKPTYPRGHKF